MRYLIALLCMCTYMYSYAQDSSEMAEATPTITKVPDKYLYAIEKKYSKISQSLEHESKKVLARMQSHERKVKQKIAEIDSSKATRFFSASVEKYKAFESRIKKLQEEGGKLKEYVPGLDSIATSLNFFSQSSFNNLINKDRLNNAQSAVSDLATELLSANEIKEFIKAREKEITEQLLSYGLPKNTLLINKEVYYYQERLSDYKELLNDKKKLEAKLLNLVTSTKAFKSFIEKYGFIASLFPTASNYDASAIVGGLQSRSAIETIITQRLGMGADAQGGQQYMQPQLNYGQSEMKDLQSKLDQLGLNKGDADMTMPDFNPNTQKTKKFFQRLEYGINIQSSRTTYFLPATSDIAATLGYKFTDKASAGFGIGYKLGWGTGWDNINFSNEGVSIRSYLDIKAKGNLWISGGFEYNYLQSFAKIEEIKNLNAWQQSALIGITRKVQIKEKKQVKIQLLYDFFAAKQLPQAQALKFRIGWTF